MRIVHHVDLIGNTAQERLPDFTSEFPCITTRAELHCYPESHTPWHWHPTAELFYMAEGELDYHLPDRTLHFGAGSGGLLMPNVLHSTSWRGAPVVTLLHLFDVRFLFGGMDSRMAQKYVAPVLNDPSRALLALPAGEPALDLLCASFDLDSRQWEYEYALHDALCGMWLHFQKLDARFLARFPDGSRGARDQKHDFFYQYASDGKSGCAAHCGAYAHQRAQLLSHLPRFAEHHAQLLYSGASDPSRLFPVYGSREFHHRRRAGRGL